ncbi:hypothetical protein NDU88_005682 [Pleurodeles waltl]|uniref:Uncharacterized protein n=1 Tax=Pleurodeles waltl TaxID=8319 RepID=A0AAV7TW81_PLEWA|nr:hypothetical protein NDU88_005682 [Pleurodeles waltl]
MRPESRDPEYRAPVTRNNRASPEAVPPGEKEAGEAAPLGLEPPGSQKDLAARRRGPDRARARNKVPAQPEALLDRRLDHKAPGPRSSHRGG